MSENGRSVVVALNGTERHLRYDVNALSDLEQHMGQPLGSALAESAIGIRTIRAMLWAGLKREAPTITVSGAGDLMQAYLDKGGNLPDLTTKMLEALSLAGFGGEKAKDSKEGAETGPFDSAPGSIAPSP